VNLIFQGQHCRYEMTLWLKSQWVHKVLKKLFGNQISLLWLI